MARRRARRQRPSGPLLHPWVSGLLIRWDAVRAFEAHGCQARCALMELASTGGLRDAGLRSLTLRRNAPPEISITTGPPCLCQIPSHIIDDVTAAVRVGAVPSVLQWQYRRLVHYPFTILKCLSTYGCSPNEFLGPTGFENEDESNGLPNDTVYITHAVLTLSDDALAINDPCSHGTPARLPKPFAWSELESLNPQQ